jgi:hypothetical protein
MDTVNGILTSCIEAILSPVSGAPAFALVAVSAVSGIAMTIVFRFTSPQRALRRVADRSRAMLLGMRLFKDDLRTALRYQWGLLKATGLRLVYSLPPMAVLVVPFVLLLVQLAQRFEHRPLSAGERAVVEVHVSDDAWRRWREASIEVPDGVTVETPGLRDEAKHAVYWRLGVTGVTVEPIRWRAGDVFIEKQFISAADPVRLQIVSIERPEAGFWSRLLHPIEPALGSESPVRRIVISYPRRSTPIFGINIPWWGTFLIVSIVTALIIRPLVRVQF